MDETLTQLTRRMLADPGDGVVAKLRYAALLRSFDISAITEEYLSLIDKSKARSLCVRWH